MKSPKTSPFKKNERSAARNDKAVENGQYCPHFPMDGQYKALDYKEPKKPSGGKRYI